MVLRLNLYAVVFIMLAVLSCFSAFLIKVYWRTLLLSSSCLQLHFARSVGLKSKASYALWLLRKMLVP